MPAFTPTTITVNDRMQRNYRYERTEPAGKHFAPDFTPHLTPKEMLALGVFGGRYMRDCRDEFPADWFAAADGKKGAGAKLYPEGVPGHDKALNYFKVDASQPLAVWQEKGWIYKDDPRGWFQWYCRYYMGRRLPEEDMRQIKRWKAMQRHVVQITGSCRTGDMACRPRQRQALLHWAYDSRKI